jgi:hypothetical protein
MNNGAVMLACRSRLDWLEAPFGANAVVHAGETFFGPWRVSILGLP